MTEDEWLKVTDPTPMLEFLRHRASNRQYILLAAACARDELARACAGRGCFNFGERLETRESHLFWHRDLGYEAAVLAAESVADGGPSQSKPIWHIGYVAEPACVAFAALGHDPEALVQVSKEEIAATVQRYTNHPSGYLRDIFGNPFCPVTLNPSWRTATVTSLAQTIYDERQLPSGLFDNHRLAILADALEEAGCDNADVLAHLRYGGEHVRGCWVVDLILGKM